MKIGNYEADILFKKSKNDPYLQQLIEMVEETSEDDIKRLPIKPWQRKGLLAIKNYKNWVARGMPSGIVIYDDEPRPVHEWIGPDTFIKSSTNVTGVAKEFLIQNGDRFLVDEKQSGIWKGYIFIENPVIDFLQTVKHEDMTRLEYVAAYRIELDKKVK